MLATAFPSPATVPAFADSIPGSLVLACRFASCLSIPLSVRPFGSTTDPSWPRDWQLLSFEPVTVSSTGMACCASGLHSPSGLLHPSGSKRSAGLLPASPPSDLARFPFAPRRRLLSLVSASDHRSRSATFRRLAVPQTSWNHTHYDPDRHFGQPYFVGFPAVFRNFYMVCFDCITSYRM